MIGDPAQKQAIKPVVALEAQILQVRTVAAGDTIGYGATFTADRDLNVAIINIGYADGYLRQLAATGYAIRGDLKLPILGRISMDLIAVGAPDRVAEGDWLQLDFNLPDLAGDLSQYELLTTLGDRYERVWS